MTNQIVRTLAATCIAIGTLTGGANAAVTVVDYTGLTLSGVNTHDQDGYNVSQTNSGQFSADPPFGLFTNTNPASNMSFKNIAEDSFTLISLDMGSFRLLPVSFDGYLSGILQASDSFTNTIGGGNLQNFTAVNLSVVTVDEIRFTMDQSATGANPAIGAFEVAIIPEPSSALLLGLAATLLALVSRAAQKKNLVEKVSR